MCHRVKFRADRRIRCLDMDILRFFKMAAVRHLGLQTFNILTAGTVRRNSVCQRAKFRANRAILWERYGHFSIF